MENKIVKCLVCASLGVMAYGIYSDIGISRTDRDHKIDPVICFYQNNDKNKYDLSGYTRPGISASIIGTDSTPVVVFRINT